MSTNRPISHLGKLGTGRLVSKKGTDTSTEPWEIGRSDMWTLRSLWTEGCCAGMPFPPSVVFPRRRRVMELRSPFLLRFDALVSAR